MDIQPLDQLPKILLPLSENPNLQVHQIQNKITKIVCVIIIKLMYFE